jgi:hypothetical protein
VRRRDVSFHAAQSNNSVYSSDGVTRSAIGGANSSYVSAEFSIHGYCDLESEFRDEQRSERPGPAQQLQWLGGHAANGGFQPGDGEFSLRGGIIRAAASNR